MPRTTGRYAEVDVEPRPPLGVRLTVFREEQLHLKLRSWHADGSDDRSGRARATAYGYQPERSVRQDSVNPHLENFRLASDSPSRSRQDNLRGGFGTGYVHYTRAGSGDITGIDAPQAQFAAGPQIKRTAASRCATVPAQIIAVGATAPSCYVTADQGFPTGLVSLRSG